MNMPNLNHLYFCEENVALHGAKFVITFQNRPKLAGDNDVSILFSN